MEVIENNSEQTRRQPSNTVFSFVSKQVSGLQKRHMENDPAARAALAKLRVSLNKQPGTVWEIVPFTIPPHSEDGPMNVVAPTDAERAAHGAMCLYGWLQQSLSKPMHIEGVGLGRACKTLVGALRNEGDDRAEDRVWKKLGAVGQATSWNMLERHLRSLINLLNDRQVGLDIARLASDLYFWQHLQKRASVQRNWARQFHAYTPKPESEEQSSPDSNKNA